MTDRELMQQALEALNSDHPDIQLRAAIALRQALETEHRPVAWHTFDGEGGYEMNERIRELEKQCWSHRVEGVLVDGQLHFDTQKFAELIVKECAEVAGCNGHISGFTLGDLIKEHFGVEA